MMLQYSTTVSNLGVLLDTQLTMADHIAAACRSGFFQLRPVLRCYDSDNEIIILSDLSLSDSH